MAAPKTGTRPCTNPECGMLTRTSKTALADAPGTLVRQGGGKCSRCYVRRKSRAGMPRTVKENPAGVEAAKASLDAYFARRRRRGIPADGLRHAS